MLGGTIFQLRSMRSDDIHNDVHLSGFEGIRSVLWSPPLSRLGLLLLPPLCHLLYLSALAIIRMFPPSLQFPSTRLFSQFPIGCKDQTVCTSLFPNTSRTIGSRSLRPVFPSCRGRFLLQELGVLSFELGLLEQFALLGCNNKGGTIERSSRSEHCYGLLLSLQYHTCCGGSSCYHITREDQAKPTRGCM